MESLLQNFFISFFTLSHMLPCMNQFLFYKRQFSPSLNKTRKLQLSTLYVQSVHASNTHNMKIHRRGVIKALLLYKLNNNFMQYID